MHGGDIYRNKVDIDFSVNINPLGIPESLKDAWQGMVKECFIYPDIQNEGLKHAIHHMTGAREDRIACGNGASELFPAILRAVGSLYGQKKERKKVLIPIPSFSGYERAAKAGGMEYVFYPLGKENGFQIGEDIKKELSKEIGLIFLANPNNPIGTGIDGCLLKELTEACKEKGIYIVLDECFIELTEKGEKNSLICQTEKFPNLIVVRSFTKTFAMPGLRLGYLVCGDSRLKEQIEWELPEWNVSALAQKAGILVAGEKEYLEKSRRLISKERAFLEKGLFGLNFQVFPSDVNYLFFYTDKELLPKLLEKGILIRDCSDYRGLGKGYYRVAVKKREENERLLEALGEMVCR